MATLFAKDKQRLLEFVLDNPHYEIRVRELAKKLGLSPAHISRTVKALETERILKDAKADLSNPFVRALKILFNIQKIQSYDIDKLAGKAKPVSTGIYGSWANGTNDEQSDLDVWLRLDKHPGERIMASVESDIRKAVGREVQLLALTPERIEKLKKEDPVFYYSLVFGSITIMGEPFERT